jgi:cellulose synthase/poly-beta-1,6-N-acetylglucosamine synthase-like glycosyltransferase
MEFLKVLLFLGGICALAAAVPGTLDILLVTTGLATTGAARKRRQPAATIWEDLRLAVVIPAHNEAALIARCVESIAASAQGAGNCETVVVADNCTDETAAHASLAGARVLIRRNAELRGKGYALRLAFDQLQAEGFGAFLVVDADSMVSSTLVSEVKRRLSAGSTVVQCRYRISNYSASIRTRLMELAFLAFNVLRPKGRSGWGLSAGILGNGFALRAETLRKIPWDAASIVEDLEYHLRLVAAGERVDFIDEATVYGETPAGGEAARVQRSRWEGGRLRMAREWTPKLALAVARGKGRLAEPLLELLTLPLAYHILLLAFALIVLPWPFRELAAAALALVAIYVLVAAFLGGQFLKTLAALAAAPFYVIWKLTTLAGVFSASRRDAGWVRTGRDSQTSPGPAK